MKILFLCATPPRSQGASDSVIAYHRIRVLSQRGHAVGLAAFLSPRRRDVPVELEGMVADMQLLPPPARIPAPAFLLPGSTAFRRYLSRDMLKMVGRLVGHSRYDVVVAESAVMGQYVYRNLHLPAVRRVISRHGSLAAAYAKVAGLEGHWPSRLAARLSASRIARYETGMYRFADRIVTITLQERLELLRSVPDLNVAVIPFGLDADEYPERDPALSEERLFLAGSMDDPPDRDGLLWFTREVWPRLRSAHPNLRLAAAYQPATRETRMLARRTPGVELLPDDETFEAGLRRARVYVCPVRLPAGFQARVLQAMAAGVPVVSTSVGADGIPARTAENLLLADSARTMAESITILLRDADLRRQVAARARALVVNRFSWQKSVARLEEELLRVVG